MPPTDLFLEILAECWAILTEASPYVLFGFFVAGLLKAFLPGDLIARHLGRDNFGSVLKASLFGIPLPLCSCGVIPAAVELRKQGASKGATAAFLVSVPETGVDSIAVTWALLDPVMTVIRPVAAFLTATLTGLFVNLLPGKPGPAGTGQEPTAGCGCSSAGCGEAAASKVIPSRRTRLRQGLDYAFGELLQDIGGWLMLGILIAGSISALVPDDFFGRLLGNETLSLVAMLAIGIPLYICASASTPIAAALILKGLSPGAALVFLLAGPATNAATLTVAARQLGRNATLVYLATIAASSLLLGWLVNLLYRSAGLDITRWLHQASQDEVSPLGLLSTLLLLGLMAKNLLKRRQQGS